MQNGKINYNKSNVEARPCPAYALEGVTKDDQLVRIVFGQCDLKTKVITVIDLNTDWSCDCPEMMINIKTGTDAGSTKAAPMDILHLCFYHFRCRYAGDLSFCYPRQFFWPYPRWQYDHQALYVMGRSVVSADIYFS
ncbi:MAG: hypothetical protein WDO71_18300 [Bacteroidota bacterium]